MRRPSRLTPTRLRGLTVLRPVCIPNLKQEHRTATPRPAGGDGAPSRIAPNYAVTTLLHTGAIVAGYRLEREVGSGGMGVVWRAGGLLPERPPALKLIRAGLAAGPRFLERFKRQAELPGPADHAGLRAVC